MKHLTVIYNSGSGPVNLYDGEVAEFVWSDGQNGLSIQAKPPAAESPAGQAAGSGLAALAATLRAAAAASQTNGATVDAG